MDEIWERAVEAALDGQTDRLATRTLTLDGAVKYVQGRLPPPSLLERFQNLHHLSIANIGISSLEQFPRLGNLQKLILSDNRITAGLEFLVEAGLDSLRDLDLSNNRIQFVEDLAPLAKLKLVSLDLYECPVTRVKDYRARVFALIKTLKYLDKTDAEGNERPESDDEDDEEDEEDEEEDEEDDEEDPGSGEIDGDERTEAPWMSNGHSERLDGVVDVDEDEESDAEDDESEQVAGVNGTSDRPNGFRLQAVNGEAVGEDDGDDSESGEEIDEEEAGEDNDVVEVHEIEDSDNEEDGVDDEEEEVEEDEEEVDNDDRGIGVSGSTGRLMNAGEIDGHEQGDDDEDGDGETGEDDQVVEDDVDFRDEDDDGEEEDEESGEGYLVQPISQVEDHDNVDSDIEPINEDNDPDEEEEVEDDLPLPISEQSLPSSSSTSSHLKRKRDEDDDDDSEDVDDDDSDGDDDDDGVDDEEG